MKIAVLIRVYDRIEDLENNLQIIRDTWLNNEYYVIVISNGYSNGFTIPESSHHLVDKLVILEENAGHRRGNAQLLMEGWKYIPEDSDYTVILEADTWIYSDKIISKYSQLLSEQENKVWASADWFDKAYALATDFAIINTPYLKKHPKLFDYEYLPECHIAIYLKNNGGDFIWIQENMPVHIPSYMKIKYPYVPNTKDGRFYVFPYSGMVTHHNEFLKNGIEDKKRYFNIVSNENYFENNKVKHLEWKRFKMRFWISLTKLFPKKSWVKKKKYIPLPVNY